MSLIKCLLKVGDGLSEEEHRIYDASVQARVAEGVPLEQAQQMAAQDRMDELSADLSTIEEARSNEELTEVPMGAGRGPYSILGNAVAQDYRKKGVSTLLGKKIRNAQDLATLAQIYRNPQYETLRYFITNDAGEVVYQTGVTSRLPGYSKAIIGEPDEFIDQVVEAGKNVGGTRVWMVHNHPSGNVQASPEDEALTDRLWNDLGDRGMILEDHVIINHKKYSTVRGETHILDVDVDYDINEPSVAHPVLGTKITGPNSVVEIGKNLEVNDDHIVVIGRKGSNGGVSLLAEITTLDLPLNRGAAIMRKLAVGSGSMDLFLYGVPEHLTPLAEAAIRQGFVRDVIIKNPDGSTESLVARGVQSEPGMYFGQAAKELSVAEYTPTETENIPRPDLYVAHNLTEKSLRHALEIGGLAAPSLAINRVGQGEYDDYGEITLLADPSIITSPKARTFDADIYSPRHPRGQYRVDRGKLSSLVEDLREDAPFFDPPSEDDLSQGAEGLINNEAVQYQYLKKMGVAPTPKKLKVESWVKKAAKWGLNPYELTEDSRFQKLMLDKYEADLKRLEEIDPELADRRDYFTHTQLPDGYQVEPIDSAFAVVDPDGNYVTGRAYSEEKAISSFLAEHPDMGTGKTVKSGILRDAAHKVYNYSKTEGVDSYATKDTTHRKLRVSKRRSDYEKYATELFNEMSTGAKLFKGFTPSGNRRYVDYNLPNIVKEMTQKLQAGESFNYGAGTVRSAFANEMKTVADVQARREQIVSSEDFQTTRQEAQDKLLEALDELKPYYKFDVDSWGYSNDASQAITEGPKGWREAFHLTDESRAIITDLVDYLRNLPTEYFETKIQRAVDLDEFSTALVPKGTSQDLVDELRAKGLKVRRYAEGQRETVVNKQQNLLFQSAYHGTPHTFDRFSLEAMGTGEGAQAFGWGLYFAGKREVAEYYRDTLGGSTNPEPYADTEAERFVAEQAVEWYNENGVYPDAYALKDAVRETDDFTIWDVRNAVDSLEEKGAFGTGSNIYQVDIPEDAELLDWDKPLSEQPENVRKKMIEARKFVEARESPGGPTIKPVGDDTIVGEGLYGALERVTGSPQAASVYLNSLGIPGLRYLEGASRKRGEGAYNYVIWDENRVTVQAVNDEMVQAEQLAQTGESRLPPRAIFNLDTHIIKLGAASDLSSFLHESAHLFLEMEKYYANKFGLTEDQQTILDWFGVGSFDDIEREHHEKWAETFEVYLREGKAPSLKLREAFAAFGRWLTRIYQELTDSRIMDADLSQEIKEVFDRMLASQAEIEAAMADPVYDMMFRSKEEAGMTEAEWAKYQRNQERRVNKAQASVDKVLTEEIRKRRSEEWNEEKAPMVEKIKEHLEKTPVYMIQKDLKNYPMDWQIVKDITGAAKITDLKLPPGSMKNEGVDPHEYAELYGYASVTEMINAIVEAKPLKHAADDIAQELMIAKHGDILNDGSIEEEAREAAHNDAQAALLIQELRALNKKTTVNREYLKAEARDTIAAMNYKEIKPNKFYAAEIRAAQRVATAQTTEEKEAGTIQRLANHYLYREAVEVKRRMERQRRHIRRVQTKEYSAKDVDKQTIGAMKVLANMFEMRNQPEQVLAMTEVLQWYDTQVKADVDATLMLPELVTALQQRDDGMLVSMDKLPDFDDLSASTVQGVYDMLRHMRYVGGKMADRKKTARGDRARKFAEAVKEKGGKDVKDRRGERVPGAEWKREFSKFLNGFPSLRNLARKLDGFADDGRAYQLIYRQIEEAQNRKVSLNAELYERFRDELGDLYRLGINHKKAGRKEYRLQSGTVRSFTVEQRLMMAVYWGTASSREAIRKGYGMTDADVMRVMQDLNVDHLNLVNAIWKINESLWPDLARAAIARHGVAPPKLDATPFEVNGAKMTGGHMRLFYDSQTLDLKNEQENAMNNMEVVPTKAGSLHARVGSGGKPVLLDKNNIARQLNEVTHYIAFSEVGGDVRSIINNKDVKDAIETKHGVGFYEALIDTIDGVTGNRAERETLKFVARLSRWARRAATAKHLMFSPRNTIQQMASLPIVLKEVGPVRAANAFLRMANPTTRKDTVAFINERSKFMENRASVVNREASEFINRMQASGKAEHVWNEFAKYGFTPQTLVDSFFAYPTWIAAYERSLETHNDEKRAVSEADTAVAESVGSGSDLHLGGMFQKNRSELHKMMTVFGSWFNNYSQRIYKATEAGTKMDINAAMEITLIPFTVAILSALLVMDEPEDDEPLPEWAGKRYAGFMAGTVPLLRDVSSTFSGFTPTMPITALLEIPYDVITLPKGEKTGLKRSIDAAKIGTSAVPVPGSGAIIRVLEFMESDRRGKETGDLLWYQAIVEGKDRN